MWHLGWVYAPSVVWQFPRHKHTERFGRGDRDEGSIQAVSRAESGAAGTRVWERSMTLPSTDAQKVVAQLHEPPCPPHCLEKTSPTSFRLAFLTRGLMAVSAHSHPPGHPGSSDTTPKSGVSLMILSWSGPGDTPFSKDQTHSPDTHGGYFYSMRPHTPWLQPIRLEGYLPVLGPSKTSLLVSQDSSTELCPARKP